VSRAFVNEDQVANSTEVLPERIISGEPNYVTLRGLALLEQQLERLRAEKEAAESIEDEDRRTIEIGRIERDLRYFRTRVESAIPVDQSHLCEHEVHFGSEVTVADENDEEHTYIIVGEDEADLHHGLIGWTSPLARALMNARVGDVVTWTRPAGNRELEVVRVRNAVFE
jgi:transcription elongation GreA/GreB family factor